MSADPMPQDPRDQAAHLFAAYHRQQEWYRRLAYLFYAEYIAYRMDDVVYYSEQQLYNHFNTISANFYNLDGSIKELDIRKMFLAIVRGAAKEDSRWYARTKTKSSTLYNVISECFDSAHRVRAPSNHVRSHREEYQQLRLLSLLLNTRDRQLFDCIYRGDDPNDIASRLNTTTDDITIATRRIKEKLRSLADSYL